MNEDSNEDYSKDTYFTKLILTALSPFVVIILTLLVWGMVAIKRRDIMYITIFWVNSFIVVFTILHASLTQELFDLFSCIDLDEGDFYMVEQPDIECWEGDHL